MLKRIGLHIVFIIISLNSYGQVSVTDSVLSAISAMPDSTKLQILKKYALDQQYRSLKTGLIYADKRLELARKSNDVEEIAETWHIYGNLYTTSGLLDNAEENYLKALAVFDSLDRSESLASILHNLGLVYFKKNDTLKCINYYKRSFDLRKKDLDSIRVGDELTTMGETYLSYKEYERSRKYLREALGYFEGIKGYRRKIDAFAYLFDNCYATGQVNCKKWIDSMIIANEILESNVYSNMINLRLSKHYLANNQPHLTAAHLDSVDFDMLYKTEVINPVNVFSELSEHYMDIGEEGNAINYKLLHRKHKDEMMNKEVQELVSNYNVRLSIRASEEEIAWSQEQNELILKKIKIEKTISLIIHIALGIIIIALLYLLYNFTGIRRTNKKLIQRREALQEAYERSSKYKERILSTRENKNDFFSIVSLKLSKPFTGLTSKLSEISDYLKNNNKDLKLKTMMEELHKEASAIEKGLERILLWSKLQRNKYLVDYTTINVNDFLHEMLPSLLGIALKKDIRIRFDVNPEINIRYDRFSLKTIVTILTENSIENSSPKSDIIIRAQKEKSACVVSVTDFGKGIPKDMQRKIFDMSRIKNETNVLESNKFGLGLLIAKLMAEKNNSTISLESKENTGTTFFIHINETNER
ncbi:MAG: tetratricopeptide repeat-containing sensor histidine kinase [Bacteroidota bacterium]|nr:tetratricopeptide repeat-containing sensor histidine kinase [Bacteroidota bacterium]